MFLCTGSFFCNVSYLFSCDINSERQTCKPTLCARDRKKLVDSIVNDGYMCVLYRSWGLCDELWLSVCSVRADGLDSERWLYVCVL